MVTEREKKLKYSLNVMGLRVIPYWLGNFIFDFMILTIMLIFFILFAVMYDNISNWNAMYITSLSGYWIAIIFFCNMSVIGLAYALSFMF